jgi:hypothetical protein
MRKTTIAAVGLAVLVLAGTASLTAKTTITVTSEPAPKPVLTQEQSVWLDALEWQESNGNPAAINPKDSDGTPSYGCLQFKPGTFDEYSQLYGIATTSLMSCPQQREIVAQMIVHGVNLRHQFPESIRKIGLPPMSTAPIAVAIDRS